VATGFAKFSEDITNQYLFEERKIYNAEKLADYKREKSTLVRQMIFSFFFKD
jgi:hypothetical protein